MIAGPMSSGVTRSRQPRSLAWGAVMVRCRRSLPSALIFRMVSGTLIVASLSVGIAGATVVPSGGEPSGDEVGGDVVVGSSGSPTTTTVPGSTPSTTTIPAECVVPTPVQATFVGTLVESDRKTARFQIVQMRGGSLEGYSSRGLVDVDYVQDVRFLEIGKSYIVAAGINSSNGHLFSKVREPEPLLGSSQVVGLNSGVNCPEVEDAVRTLDLNGRSVESGVLAPLGDATGRMLRSVVLPLAWVLAALMILATMRNMGSAFMKASFRYWNGEPVVRRQQRRR